MRVHRLEREQRVEGEPDAGFEFYSLARNLERITPPWLRFRVITPEPIEIGAGTLIDYRLRLHGIPLRWRTRIERWEPGRLFVDRQVRGPYRLWHHRHEFQRVDGGMLVRDIVHYALPLGRLGELAQPLVARDLVRIFDHRHAAVAGLLADAA